MSEQQSEVKRDKEFVAAVTEMLQMKNLKHQHKAVKNIMSTYLANAKGPIKNAEERKHLQKNGTDFSFDNTGKNKIDSKMWQAAIDKVNNGLRKDFVEAVISMLNSDTDQQKQMAQKICKEYIETDNAAFKGIIDTHDLTRNVYEEEKLNTNLWKEAEKKINEQTKDISIEYTQLPKDLVTPEEKLETLEVELEQEIKGELEKTSDPKQKAVLNRELKIEKHKAIVENQKKLGIEKKAPGFFAIVWRGITDVAKVIWDFMKFVGNGILNGIKSILGVGDTSFAEQAKTSTEVESTLIEKQDEEIEMGTKKDMSARLTEKHGKTVTFSKNLPAKANIVKDAKFIGEVQNMLMEQDGKKRMQQAKKIFTNYIQSGKITISNDLRREMVREWSPSSSKVKAKANISTEPTGPWAKIVTYSKQGMELELRKKESVEKHPSKKFGVKKHK